MSILSFRNHNIFMVYYYLFDVFSILNLSILFSGFLQFKGQNSSKYRDSAPLSPFSSVSHHVYTGQDQKLVSPKDSERNVLKAGANKFLADDGHII